MINEVTLEGFVMKTRDGTLKNPPNKMGTTQYFYTIPTSCAILPTVLVLVNCV